MSDHDETPSKFSLPSWFFSVVGVAGSIVIMVAVLGIAYYSSRPASEVDAAIVAKRKKTLADVQAQQADLYNNYSWANQAKHIVRIPVAKAVEIMAAKLDAATKDEPPAPPRLSLAASPDGFVPPPPPVVPTAAPAVGTATPVGPAPAAASATPAATAPAAPTP